VDKRTNSALDLATAHLNAPVGQVLTRDDLSAALRKGTLAAVARPDAASLVCFMFIELEPALISRCVMEAHSDFQHANALYRDTLHAHAPRSPAWERSVEHLL
jgi:hypothetical protein